MTCCQGGEGRQKASGKSAKKRDQVINQDVRSRLTIFFRWNRGCGLGFLMAQGLAFDEVTLGFVLPREDFFTGCAVQSRAALENCRCLMARWHKSHKSPRRRFWRAPVHGGARATPSFCLPHSPEVASRAHALNAALRRSC